MEITQQNFNDYFFNVRTNTYKPGQILCSFTIMADLVKGDEKNQLIDLLLQEGKAIAASQMMKNLFYATELDSVKIPVQIMRDLLNGMSKKQVLRKKYRYQMEILYYSYPECIPDNDPHWKVIGLNNIDMFKLNSENTDLSNI